MNNDLRNKLTKKLRAIEVKEQVVYHTREQQPDEQLRNKFAKKLIKEISSRN